MTASVGLGFCVLPLDAACSALVAFTSRSYGLSLRLLNPSAILVMSCSIALQTAVLTVSNVSLTAAGIVIAIAALAVSCISDLQTGYIFDTVTLPCTSLILGLCALSGQLVASFQGCIACASALLLIYGLTHGRALGLGDVKLAGCIGAATGVHCALLILQAAFLIGGAHATWLLLAKHNRRTDAVPFAPYLGAGAAVALLLRGIA